MNFPKIPLPSFNRDAINDLALHFLTKMKIMVLRDIERDEVEFICKVGWLDRLLVVLVLNCQTSSVN